MRQSDSVRQVNGSTVGDFLDRILAAERHQRERVDTENRRQLEAERMESEDIEPIDLPW